MKRVVLKQECDVIDLSQITNDSIVGVKHDRFWGFLTQTPEGDFFACERNFDNDGCWVENSKQNAAKKLIERGCEVFVFDSLKELYTWLAED